MNFVAVDWDPKTDEEIILGMGQAPPGEYHRPYRNKRFLPFLRDNEFESSSYAALQKDIVGRDQDFRYQTLAADLLVEGAFNINSTSVDAWISHLASLKQLPVPKGSYPHLKHRSFAFSISRNKIHGIK